MITRVPGRPRKLSTPGSGRRGHPDTGWMNETGNTNALGRFLTLADVAEVLNISSGAADALVRSGELPAIKVGRHGRWRIERSVLESYIEAKYEEARRANAWREAEFEGVLEPAFGVPDSAGGFPAAGIARPDLATDASERYAPPPVDGRFLHGLTPWGGGTGPGER
jgi:excisionase family DNA binding protein